MTNFKIKLKPISSLFLAFLLSLLTLTSPSLASSSEIIFLNNIKKHVYFLSKKIKSRDSGTEGEKTAARYIKNKLISYRFTPEMQTFPLPSGLSSSNIIATKPGGQSNKILILGAHYDSKDNSPGANDNGTGVGILLEIARIFSHRPSRPTLKFIFFGAEEMVDKNPDHHHYGSRYYVKNLSLGERKKIVGMVSIDMVGYGKKFHVRSMKVASMTMVNTILTRAKVAKIKISFLRSKEWSDHEPFEKVGISSAWLEWKSDPYHHTLRDNYDHINWKNVKTTFLLVKDLVENFK